MEVREQQRSTITGSFNYAWNLVVRRPSHNKQTTRVPPKCSITRALLRHFAPMVSIYIDYFLHGTLSLALDKPARVRALRLIRGETVSLSGNFSGIIRWITNEEVIPRNETTRRQNTWRILSPHEMEFESVRSSAPLVSRFFGVNEEANRRHEQACKFHRGTLDSLPGLR